MFRNACIDHGRFKTTKSVTLCLLCFLKFLKQFSFHTFQLLSLALVVRDLILEIIGLIIDISTSICYLLPDKFILTIYTSLSVFFNLGLSLLCLHVCFFTHSVKTLLHHLFLLAHLFNNSQFCLNSCITSIADFIRFFSTPCLRQFLLFFCYLYFSLFICLGFSKYIIIFGLQFGYLFSFLASFLDFLKCSYFFLLKHSNSVSELFYVPLNLKSN